MGERPVPGKLARAEELLVRVLLVDVDGLKVVLDETLAQERRARDELRLGEVGVEDKGVVLVSQD